MSAFARIDKAEFLRIAEAHEGPLIEFVRGRIVQQMTGGTRDHGVISRRIFRQLEDQLDPLKWTSLGERGVETAVSIRYPDIVVEPADEPGKSPATSRPALIVEVLSPSTAATELDVKPAEYLAIPSLDVYVIASQDEPAMLIYQRAPDGRFAEEPMEVAGASAEVELRCRSFVLTLQFASIYQGVGQ